PPPRAESLAKAGARHAAPVLAAYADALNDPLCAMPADVRRALRPGLFALCEMLNEHTRDALMAAALDAAGKAAMKALWREYEKQKYVGRG
ncbi:Urb2/Npa2 family-domain-containing protein, partial [Schizophyllum fasciatum]